MSYTKTIEYELLKLKSLTDAELKDRLIKVKEQIDRQESKSYPNLNRKKAKEHLIYNDSYNYATAMKAGIEAEMYSRKSYLSRLSPFSGGANNNDENIKAIINDLHRERYSDDAIDALCESLYESLYKGDDDDNDKLLKKIMHAIPTKYRPKVIAAMEKIERESSRGGRTKRSKSKRTKHAKRSKSKRSRHTRRK